MTLIYILGKFDTSTRRGKVTVDGNIVYCSIENFREYANYSRFFLYGYEPGQIPDIPSPTPIIEPPAVLNTVGQVKTFNKATYIYSNSNLTGARYDYKTNTTAEILENTSSSIDKIKVRLTGRIGYVDNTNLYKGNSISNISSAAGEIKTFKGSTTIYENSNLTGIQYNYLKNTTVNVLEKLNGIDKVKVRLTGRTGYVSTSVYK